MRIVDIIEKKGRDEFHTSSLEKLSEAREIFLEAYIPSTSVPAARPLILAYVDNNTVTKY